MNLRQLPVALVLAGSALLCGLALAADNVKIAVIDPLSGPFANVGEAMVRYTTLAAEAINARGGVLGGAKIEIIALDSKSSPQEAQLALKSAIDQGVRFINQSNHHPGRRPALQGPGAEVALRYRRVEPSAPLAPPGRVLRSTHDARLRGRGAPARQARQRRNAVLHLSGRPAFAHREVHDLRRGDRRHGRGGQDRAIAGRWRQSRDPSGHEEGYGARTGSPAVIVAATTLPMAR